MSSSVAERAGGPSAASLRLPSAPVGALSAPAPPGSEGALSAPAPPGSEGGDQAVVDRDHRLRRGLRFGHSSRQRQHRESPAPQLGRKHGQVDCPRSGSRPAGFRRVLARGVRQADQLAVAVRSPIPPVEHQDGGRVQMLGERPGLIGLIGQGELRSERFGHDRDVSPSMVRDQGPYAANERRYA